MYLVSATLGSYNSTDYLHFVAKKIEQNNKKRNEKEKGKGKRASYETKNVQVVLG